ncbi:MAG: hypothetical protein ACXW1W_15000 [Methylococcaceae bacterium]
MKTILVAGGSKDVLASISEMLNSSYLVKLANISQACLKIATTLHSQDFQRMYFSFGHSSLHSALKSLN